MDKNEAFDIMTDAFEDFDAKLTLGLPLTDTIMEDAWWGYCNGVMPNGLLRKALVRALRDAD